MHGGLDPSSMDSWSQQLQQWQEITETMVSDMVGCAWCGRVAMGGAHSVLRSGMRKATSHPTSSCSQPHHGCVHGGQPRPRHERQPDPSVLDLSFVSSLRQPQDSTTRTPYPQVSTFISLHGDSPSPVRSTHLSTRRILSLVSTRGADGVYSHMHVTCQLP
jgi:hypothetical protein